MAICWDEQRIRPPDGKEDGSDDVITRAYILPTVEAALRYGLSRGVILNAIRHLELRYGSEEAAAIELLRGALPEIPPR